MTTKKNTSGKGDSARYIVVAVLVIGAFFGAYQFAQASNNSATAASGAAVVQGTGATNLAPAPGTGGGGCCGGGTAPQGGVTGPLTEGAATVANGVQTISVDLSKGIYEPNSIKLKAGVPAEITFGQAGGCTGQVISSDLGFSEDLTTGPKTVKLPALEPGEYSFSCGMQMVFGKIVVE